MGKNCPRCGTEITDPNSPYCPNCLIIVNPTSLDKTKKHSNSFTNEGFKMNDDDCRKIFKKNPQLGRDILLRIKIRLEDAISGFDREVEVTHTEQCTSCTCPSCHGSGRLGEKPGLFGGNFGRSWIVCSRCRGTGNILEGICKDCQSTGHYPVNRRVPVHIPAGIENGTRLCIKGMGDAGNDGEMNGDLFLEVHIQEKTDPDYKGR